MKTTNQETKRLPETMNLSLNFGFKTKKLSKQLKAQGFKFDKDFSYKLSTSLDQGQKPFFKK
jgi:hypothetical protein